MWREDDFALDKRSHTLPGVVLPVNPSTLLVWKHLQKFDPSDYPSGGVREPSGLRPSTTRIGKRIMEAQNHSPRLATREAGQYRAYGKCHKDSWKSSNGWPGDECDEVSRPKLFDRQRMKGCRDGETECAEGDGHGDV